jgi:lipoyl-dependent peroxiredoxin subunit D
MDALKSLGASFPEAARDIKLNLQAVLQESVLDPRLRWAVALACAFATRNATLREAVRQDGEAHLDEAAADDARAAAVLMAMNNVYYRFRHVVGNPAYQTLPARLRMTRIAAPKTSKLEFELLCLAVSAINNCEACVRAHEAAVLGHGMTVQHVQDAVRIAAVIAAAAVALESVEADANGF